MDHSKFFNEVRRTIFRGDISQQQVDGMNAILDACVVEGLTDEEAVAYILATAYHETGAKMWPVHEIGKGRGRAYGKPGSNNGQIPYGRGFVQITWDRNYEKADKELNLGGALVRDYNLALDPQIAARILVRGCMEGWFTNKDVFDYLGADEEEWEQARRVVNGMDKAKLIASYAIKFDKALEAAGGWNEDNDMRKPLNYDSARPRGQNNDGQREPYEDRDEGDERTLLHRGEDGRPPIGKVNMTKGDMKKLQLALYKKGYTEVGMADGVFGKKCKVALGLWASDNKTGAIRVVDTKLTRQIENGPARSIPRSRAEITPSELAKRGSNTITASRVGQGVGVGGAVLGGGGAIIEGMSNQVETVTGSVTRVTNSLGPFSWIWNSISPVVWWLLAAVVFAGLAYLFHKLIWMRVMQERTGRTTTNPVKVETLNELEDDDDEPVTA